MPSRSTDRTVIREQLALYGGQPVRDTWLPYGHHTIDEEDITAVVDVLRSDWITQGPKIEKFERAVADYCDAKFGVAFSSGTAALHASCRVAGLEPGDEAITTPLTFIATANAVVYCGAKPVFADIDSDTLNIDPAAVERQITPKTKVVIPVDFAGCPADLDPILFLAKKNNLIVVEDACHALGAEFKERKIGSISHITVLSFHPVKHITTGEGGMVLTDDKMFAERLRKLRHHGIIYNDSQKPWQYEISDLGYNYRLSDIHCALGISQLHKLDGQLSRRHEIAEHYRQAFFGLKGISLPPIRADVKHGWHLFIALLNLDKLTVDRDCILEALRAENIGTTLHYSLVHFHLLYKERFGFTEGTCPVAEAKSPRMITLPLFSSMTDKDVRDVIDALVKVLEHYAGES